MMKRLSVALFVAAIFAVTPASIADSECQPVVGTIQTDAVPCPSICTAGTIDAGALSGSTTFVLTSAHQEGKVLFFCGVFTVTTPTGSTATFDTCGTLNLVNGRYEETFTLSSGTGEFDGKTAHLFSGGTSTATGFQGIVSGTLCN